MNGSGCEAEECLCAAGSKKVTCIILKAFGDYLRNFRSQLEWCNLNSAFQPGTENNDKFAQL